MPGIGLVLNPRAKRNTHDPDLANRLARQLDGEGVVRVARTFEELALAAEEFKKLDVGLLAVAGGDGTNHVTISGLVQVYGQAQLPYVALLRGGTMNTVANSFGIPRRRPEALLHRYRRAFARHALQPMRFVQPHVLRVADRYGFIFGTGAIYGFIAEYNQRAERSAAWAARVLGTAIASAVVGGPAIRRVAQRWHGAAYFDDGTVFPDRDYLTVGASTCGQIGLGFKPFYRNAQRPGHIHVLGIHASAGSFIAGLPLVWRGQPQGGLRTYEKLCRRVVLRSHDGVSRYALDGDVYEQEGEIEVGCGPTLRIVIP
jgi:diacylglycerol kinase family enzyme